MPTDLFGGSNTNCKKRVALSILCSYNTSFVDSLPTHWTKPEEDAMVDQLIYRFLKILGIKQNYLLKFGKRI